MAPGGVYDDAKQSALPLYGMLPHEYVEFVNMLEYFNAEYILNVLGNNHVECDICKQLQNCGVHLKVTDNKTKLYVHNLCDDELCYEELLRRLE